MTEPVQTFRYRAAPSRVTRVTRVPGVVARGTVGQDMQFAPEQVECVFSREVRVLMVLAGGSLAELASPRRLVFSAGSLVRL